MMDETHTGKQSNAVKPGRRAHAHIMPLLFIIVPNDPKTIIKDHQGTSKTFDISMNKISRNKLLEKKGGDSCGKSMSLETPIASVFCERGGWKPCPRKASACSGKQRV